MILSSAYPELVIPNKSLHEYMLENFKSYPSNKPALISAFGNSSYTFKELMDAIVVCRDFLLQSGIHKGETVALCCPNIPDFVVVLIGTAFCGGIVTTCNPLFTEYEIFRQLQDSKPKIVFTVSAHKNKLQNVLRRCSWLKEEKLIILEESNGNVLFKQPVKNLNIRNIRKVTINPHEDTVVLPYSSGTTGNPKGVMLSHMNFVSGIVISRINWMASYHDVEYLVLPLFHIYGMLRCLSTLGQGATVVLDQRFHIDRAAKAFETYKITICPIVPPMLLAFAKSNIECAYNLTKLRTLVVGAAPIASDLLQNVAKKFDCAINQAWGMTETTGVSVIMNLASYGIPSNSCGKLCPMHFIKICDVETGKELEANKRGEILVKGPSVMMGYHENPEATAEVFDNDGFLHTGDIGYFDDLKQLYVVDRVKELIKYKGFQVAPAELEHVLMHHPKIQDAAVIGVSDEEAGEVAKAFVVKKIASLSKNEINRHMREKLSKYKQLHGGIEFVESIPKSASGKILRRILRALNSANRKSKL